MKKTLAKPLTLFGMQIKIELMKLSKTQEWLISELKKETGLFADSSLMYKILVGTNNNPKIITAIEKILNIKKEK